MDQPQRSGNRLLAILFRPFAVVNPEEVVTAAIMMATVFFLLTSYYLLKTAREPLILLHGGAEVKSYAAAGQSLLLIPVVRIYASLAKRAGRTALISSVYLFFFANLIIFAVLAQLGAPLGVVFYLWVGIFNVTVIAQFWSLANDVYTPEQGKRLFAVLGIGSSLGAVLGSRIAKSLVSLGPSALMGCAAGVLLLCLGLILVVLRREQMPSRATAPGEAARKEEPPPIKGGFRELLADRYLLLIAALTLLLNWVNSTGEYILDRTLLAAAPSQAALQHLTETAYVGAFKAEYFGYVNLVSMLLQLFAVSRILKIVGVRGALFFLPVVAFGGYGLLLVAPALRIVQVVKIAENSLDYSVENTARQALFLVASRIEKYVGKMTIDTFVVRIGDVLSAGVVLLGTRFAFSTRMFAMVNLTLIAIWFVVLLAIRREHLARSRAEALTEAAA